MSEMKVLKGPKELDEGIQVRLMKRSDKYYVEFLDENQYSDNVWSVFGGSIGFHSSIFSDHDEAEEFYDTLDEGLEEASEEYPKIIPSK